MFELSPELLSLFSFQGSREPVYIYPSSSKVIFKLNLPMANSYVVKETGMLICRYIICEVLQYSIITSVTCESVFKMPYKFNM